MKKDFHTPRLRLHELSQSDCRFISELLNSEGWLKFIGDRNVRSEDDARNYISKILATPGIIYYVVTVAKTNEKIGIITVIKRDYLEYSDLGFAFLPGYSKMGYAYEASATVLDYLRNDLHYPVVLATTLKENQKSINLLEKLKFKYQSVIKVNENDLLVYSAGN